MLIQVHSNHSIDVSQGLEDRVRASLASTLTRFDHHLMRLQVHLHDENGGKGGAQDKRCQIEARLKNHDPLSVTHKAESLELAITGATTKLGNALDHLIGKHQL